MAFESLRDVPTTPPESPFEREVEEAALVSELHEIAQKKNALQERENQIYHELISKGYWEPVE